MNPLGQKAPNMLLGKSRQQLLIVPERMKHLGQRRNDAQLWMCLVVKVESDAIKNNIAKEYGMLGPWIKVNRMWPRVNIDILGTSELNGWESVNLIQMTIILYLLLWAGIP